MAILGPWINVFKERESANEDVLCGSNKVKFCLAVRSWSLVARFVLCDRYEESWLATHTVIMGLSPKWERCDGEGAVRFNVFCFKVAPRYGSVV